MKKWHGHAKASAKRASPRNCLQRRLWGSWRDVQIRKTQPKAHMLGCWLPNAQPLNQPYDAMLQEVESCSWQLLRWSWVMKPSPKLVGFQSSCASGRGLVFSPCHDIGLFGIAWVPTERHIVQFWFWASCTQGSKMTKAGRMRSSNSIQECSLHTRHGSKMSNRSKLESDTVAVHSSAGL